MSNSHWEIIHRRLQDAVARAKLRGQAFVGALADKLVLKRQETEAREALRQHRLADPANFEAFMGRPDGAGSFAGYDVPLWPVSRTDAAAALRRCRVLARNRQAKVQRTAPGQYLLCAQDSVVLTTGVRSSHGQNQVVLA